VAASKRRLKAEMGFFSKAPPPEPEPRPTPIVYFVATVDATFISKYELDVTEVGTEVDLVLSFVAVVATEAWTVFV
jgi:hypothetical protein